MVLKESRSSTSPIASTSSQISFNEIDVRQTFKASINVRSSSLNLPWTPVWQLVAISSPYFPHGGSRDTKLSCNIFVFTWKMPRYCIASCQNNFIYYSCSKVNSCRFTSFERSSALQWSPSQLTRSVSSNYTQYTREQNQISLNGGKIKMTEVSVLYRLFISLPNRFDNNKGRRIICFFTCVYVRIKICRYLSGNH